MSKSQQQEKKQKLEFFKFTKETPEIVGKLSGIVKTMYGYAIELDKKILVGIQNAVLESTIKANADKISIGTEFRIVYTGKTKGGGKYTYSTFDIYIDGEKCEGGFQNVSIDDFRKAALIF
jgi:hypothetical protein